MGSTVPLFRAALVDALVAADWGGQPPEVIYGNPLFEPPREYVSVGSTFEAEGSAQEWAAIGKRRREERYGLMVTIGVSRPGDSAREATERAWAIADVLMAVLKDDPLQGVPGVWNGEVALAGDEPTASDEGGACLIQARVQIQARI